MALTPLDVDNLKLRSALRGYDRGDVDHFRAEVIATLEEQLEQTQRIKARLLELESELKRFRDNEETLKSSMLLAQRTADELIAAARERAGALLAQAQGQADDIRRGVGDLKSQRERFEYEFHGLLSGFLKRLEQGNPTLAGTPTASMRGRDGVVSSMDTQRTPPAEEPESGDAVQIDMEDFSEEPTTTVIPGGSSEHQPVVLPMDGTARRRSDADSLEFSAALDSAASRQQTLREAQAPISGSQVHEAAELGGSLEQPAESMDDPGSGQHQQADPSSSRFNDEP